MFSGMLQDNRLTYSSSCVLTELCRKPIWILSDAARAGCHHPPLRSAQWSFIVLLLSVMLHRGVSGGLASGGTCQGVRVCADWASCADTRPGTLPRGTDTEEGGGGSCLKMSGATSHTLQFIHTWCSPANLHTQMSAYDEILIVVCVVLTNHVRAGAGFGRATWSHGMAYE